MKADDYVFPPTDTVNDGVPVGGLTVRDHIAIEAMDSVARCMVAAAAMHDTLITEEALVAMCYVRADAMIEQSNK